jgi:peptidoglycan/LPS O-acetylase OafA/YrhL
VANPRIAYMPQLDGLRAYAVGAVLAHHLLETNVLPAALLPSPGFLGVRLFFVLSGFLITGLLLQARENAQLSGAPKAVIFRQFYLRRALRIFPLYYLVLLVAFFFGSGAAREQLPWLASYTYNFWISALGWYPAYFSHFWSLCVEEQFYLVWPWIIVLAPIGHLRFYAMAMVVAAVAFRWGAIVFEFNPNAYYTLTPGSLDALGSGALLAMFTNGKAAPPELVRTLAHVTLPLLLIAQLACVFGFTGSIGIWYDAIIAFVFTWLVAGASRGFSGIGRTLLESRAVVYLGKISYGVYVYHLFVPTLLGIIFQMVGLALPADPFLRFGVFTATTIALASLSWFAFERPINRLKDRLAYDLPTPVAGIQLLSPTRGIDVMADTDRAQ